MSGRVLRYTMVVRHPDTFESTVLLAGEQVPSWAKDLVHADDYESDAASKRPAEKK